MAKRVSSPKGKRSPRRSVSKRSPSKRSPKRVSKKSAKRSKSPKRAGGASKSKKSFFHWF